MASTSKPDPKQKKYEKKDEDLSEEDLALKQQLELYVERVQDSDPGLQKFAPETAESMSVRYPPVFPSLTGDVYPSPGGGIYPFRGPSIGGDMLVGPNDPRWFGSREHPPFGDRIPSVPQGARFDPYGPPGVPGFEPGRFVRGPQPLQRKPHPDLEHLGDPEYI